MIATIPLPYRVLGIALVVAGIAVGAYWRGHVAASDKCRLAELESIAAYAEAYELEVKRGNDIAAEFEQYRSKQRPIRTGLATKADRLRPCGNAPADLVGLHDAAAKGEALPEPASKLACTPSATVDHVHFARTVVENYGACNEYIQQLNALIDWHEGKK